MINYNIVLIPNKNFSIDATIESSLYKISKIGDSPNKLILSDIKIPYELEQYMNKYYINVKITSPQILDQLNKIDKYFIEIAGSKNLIFTSSLKKYSKDSDTYFLLRLSIPIIKNRIVCKITDNVENKCKTIFDINKDTVYSKIIIKLNTFWIYNDKCGINWIVNEIKR